MKWIPLETQEQLEEIKGSLKPSLIFKHSTRCSISMMARKRFELDWDALPSDTNLYFLDLLRYRELSNSVADIYNVFHQSPQILLIKDGECIYEASHGEISPEEIAEQITVIK
ncbi:MAG: bacillithiol system redox-active protein YtxJ [Flavobacterium sp.]|nr:bacillithiol system redox-active protein YtxJ [Pedobacter sp.]